MSKYSDGWDRVFSKTIELTLSELEKLPEYSCTVPTLGKHDGRIVGVMKWKRNINAFDHIRFINKLPPLPPEWWIGEYVFCSDPNYYETKWKEAVLV